MKTPELTGESATLNAVDDTVIDLASNPLQMPGITLRTFAEAAADAETDFNDTDSVPVFVQKDETNWKRGEAVYDAATLKLTVTWTSVKGSILIGEKADVFVSRGENLYLDTGETVTGEFADARISESSVTQHQGAIDHGSIAGLADDDHAQYPLLAGRATGQKLTGGTAAGESLTLESTEDVTKGFINLGSGGLSAYDEVNDRLGIGTPTPDTSLTVKNSFRIFSSSVDMYPNIFENLDESASSRIIFSMKLTGDDSVGRDGGRVVVGKEQLWTSVADTRDGYLAFHVTKDNVPNNEVGRFTSGGNFGLQIATPNSRLSILSNEADGAGASNLGLVFQFNSSYSKSGIFPDSGSGYRGILNFATNPGANSHTLTTRLSIDADGHTIPGTDSAYDLGLSGTRWRDLYIVNAPTEGSDSRKKENVTDLDSTTLDFLNTLKPISYTWVEPLPEPLPTESIGIRSTGKPPSAENQIHYGLIAQELRDAITAFGNIPENYGIYKYDIDSDFYGIRYTEFVPMLIEAIQILSAGNTTLTDQVAALEAENATLTDQIIALDARVTALETP